MRDTPRRRLPAPSSHRAVPWALVLGVALLCPTARAEAQLGWIKGLFGGKKAKPAAEAPAAAPAPAGMAPAPAPPTTPTGVPSGGLPTSAPPGMSGPPTSQGGAAPAAASNPVLEEERRKQLDFGYGLDTQPLSVQSADARVNHWQMMRFAYPSDFEVLRRHQQALRDLEQAKLSDSTSRAKTVSMEDANKKLEKAVYALRANSFSDAENIADDILSTDPNNERARTLKKAAQKGEQARRLRYTLIALGGAAVALFALFAAFSGKIFGKKEKEEKPSGGGATAGTTGGKVYLKVVDGVGRGRLVQLSGDVFRIGATAGAGEDDRNDLVISDDAQSVSRFHCSVVRKGKDFFLVDSSLNGTRLNDKPLARGATQRLRDGDEFTLADVSLIKFMKT